MAAHKLVIFIIASMTVVLISCDVQVPIKEMVHARTAIEKARMVNAEKYDPDNYNKAVDELKSSHGLMINKEAGNAKKAAIASSNFAELAIQTSLPRVTDDTIAEAKTMQKEADALNAGQYAPEKLAQAGTAIDESEKLKNDQKLWDAFQKAREAKAAAKEAKDVCQAKIPQLNEDIVRMKKEIDELNSRNLTGQQKQDLAGAQTKLTKAGELISQNNIKNAVPLINESGSILNKVKVAALKISAKERIAQLRKEVDTLKRERGSEFAGEDIEVVVTTINEAESLLDQDKTDEANKKIGDAESSLAIAKEKTVKGLALDKAKSVEKLLEETRKGDTKNRFTNETNRAAEMIADGRKLMESGTYKDSLLKFNEAEALLYSLGIVKEKESLKQKGFLTNLEGKTVYKVIYNKKKRDCLWRIANKVYKDAKLWPLIYMANKDQIKDPDLIFPGQKFVIPDIPEKKNQSEKENAEKKELEKKEPEKKEPEKKEPEKKESDEKSKDTLDEDLKE